MTRLMLIILFLTIITYNSKANLLLAIRENNIVAVKTLLKSGKYDLNPPTEPYLVNKPLAIAASVGNLEIAKLLLKAGADINGQVAYGDVPLIKALENGNRELIDYLIRVGADVNKPNAFGISPFIGLCMGEDLELVKLAHKNGGLINARFEDLTDGQGKLNRTPLHYAIQYKRKEVIKYLMDNGANPYLLTSGGEDAFVIAKNYPDILKILRKEK